MLDELIATRGVEEIHVARGPSGVMALHGGIENRTAELAIRTAELADASLYAVVQPDDFAWHIPSHEYDPAASPELSSFLNHVGIAVSFHGFNRPGYEGTVLAGGSSRRLAAAIAEVVRRRCGIPVVADLDRIPEGLRGINPANPVNLPEFGGAQLELSQEVRSDGQLEGIAGGVAAALRAEQRGLCLI